MLLKGGGGGCHPKKSVFTSLTETDVSEWQSLLSHDHRQWTSFSLSTVLFLSRQLSLVTSHGWTNILIAYISPAPSQRMSNSAASWGLETWQWVCMHGCACVCMWCTCVCFRRARTKEKKKQNHHQRPHKAASQPQVLGLDWMNGSYSQSTFKACPLLTWRRFYGFWRVKFPFWFVLNHM